MIRLTKLTDYGIVLLTVMAKENEGVVHSARELSTQSHIPLPMVSKALKALAHAGLLVPHRGVKGGYGLAKAPAAITVAAIIEALEGPVAMTECNGEGGTACGLERLCPCRDNWRRINQAVHEALESVSLAEMAGSAPERRLAAGARA